MLLGYGVSGVVRIIVGGVDSALDHPTLILDETIDLACVESQISTGIPESDPRDCELLQWEGEEVFGKVLVPSLE
jgi:hypothetical protein